MFHTKSLSPLQVGIFHWKGQSCHNKGMGMLGGLSALLSAFSSGTMVPELKQNGPKVATASFPTNTHGSEQHPQLALVLLFVFFLPFSFSICHPSCRPQTTQHATLVNQVHTLQKAGTLSFSFPCFHHHYHHLQLWFTCLCAFKRMDSGQEGGDWGL